MIGDNRTIIGVTVVLGLTKTNQIFVTSSQVISLLMNLNCLFAFEGLSLPAGAA